VSPTSSPVQRVLAVARVVPPLALILLATTWPISRFQDHAHWADVEWVPFSEFVRPFDIVANVLLFVPFGMALAWGADRRHVRRAVLAALALALAVELSQVYTHNRIATTTDVITNTAGAWLGAWLATRRRDDAGLSALPAQDRDELRAS
jgi:glycopeptide antibiotics resistance protein